MTIEHDQTEGALRMLVFSAESRRVRPGGGALLYLPVALKDEEGDGLLRLTDAVVADAYAQPVPANLSSERVTVNALPTVFSLQPNRPNPFNPNTVISYEVPQQAHVKLTVYNILGQEVIRLVDGVRAPGRYTIVWQGRNRDGQGVASGVYLYRMTTDKGFTKTRRMTLLK